MCLKKIMIGTRKSKLAMIQAREVLDRIKARYPDQEAELVQITTRGDRLAAVAVSEIEGKGIFLKELEDALLDGKIDCAVHSMKDVPTELHQELIMGIIMKREDPHDALISNGYSIAALPQGSSIGTGSIRRTYQLLAYRPDLRIQPVRGNIDTRINKLQNGQHDALVLAVAGLRRMGLESMVSQVLPYEIMLPAAGQGAIGIEVRANNRGLLEHLSFLNDHDTSIAVGAERAFLHEAGGGCRLPIAVYGTINDREVRLIGRIAHEESGRMIEGTVSGSAEDACALGKELAHRLLKPYPAEGNNLHG